MPGFEITATPAVDLPPSFEMTATPSIDEAPCVQGQLTALPPAMGQMKYDPEKPKNSGKAGLYSCARGSIVSIDPKSKSFKKMKLASRCQKLWNEAKEFIRQKDEYATEIEVNSLPNPDAPNRDIVTVTYKDKVGDIRHISQRDIPQSLINRMEKLRKLIRPNRSIQPTHPLQLPVAGVLPQTCSQFLTTHQQVLESELRDPAKSEALRNIITTEAFIQGFDHHLNLLIKKKQDEFNGIPLLPHISRKDKDEELKKLRHLQQQLNSIDRYAVFKALASWGNLNTESDDTTRAQIRLVADSVSLSARRDLEELEKQRKAHHWFKNSTVGRGLVTITPLARHYEPLDSETIHGYGLDVGDLLLADRWDYHNRQDKTERTDKQTSIEQFIVHSMMSLLNPAIQVEEAHPFLESLDSTTRQEIISLIEAPLSNDKSQYFPKAFARATYERAGETLNPLADQDLQARLSALKSNPDISHFL